jgi:hypothetical protein
MPVQSRSGFPTVRSARHGAARSARHGWQALAAVLAGGVALTATGAVSGLVAAPASASALSRVADATTASGVGTVVQGLTKSAKATFSATYHVVNPTTKENESVTFAQTATEEAIVTPKESFYVTQTAVTECSGTGTVTCVKLPPVLVAAVGDLKELFSPGVLVDTIQGIQAVAAKHPGGVSVTTSSAKYDRLGSTCITLKGGNVKIPVTYCAANTTGVLDHANSNGSTLTLTSFSAHPSASTFDPPKGAKVIAVSKL